MRARIYYEIKQLTEEGRLIDFVLSDWGGYYTPEFANRRYATYDEAIDAINVHLNRFPRPEEDGSKIRHANLRIIQSIEVIEDEETS